MSILRSLVSAFSMYSAIPMPNIEWKEENHRYSLCFFPLIGALIGLLWLLWSYICGALGIGGLLKGAVSALLPLIITGGIHADGFCDVIDAKRSLGSREKKLSVMADPHIGAFAVIFFAAYLLLQAAVFSEIRTFPAALAAACGFVLSRCFSGVAAVTFKAAKKEGTLQSFSEPAAKTVTVSVLLMIAVIMYGAMLLTDILCGALTLGAVLLCFAYYRISAYRSFGGITGDTEGWFLQICEIAAPAAALLTEFIERAVI